MKKIVACCLILAMFGAVSTVCLASSSLEDVISEYNEMKASFNGFADACTDFVARAKSEEIDGHQIENFIRDQIEPAKYNIENMKTYYEQCGNMLSVSLSFIECDINMFEKALRVYPEKIGPEDWKFSTGECELDVWLAMINSGREIL